MANNKDLNRLKVILAEKKKSNLWLSKQLGCAPTTVSKWCTNSSTPPPVGIADEDNETS